MSTSGSDTKSGSPHAPVTPSPNTKFAAAVTNAPPSMELHVAIRRFRVVVLATVMISLLLGIVYTLREGRELWSFNAADKTTAQQEKMLDNYNSYSANVATVFGTPVELFVSAAVQVILVRFLTRSITAAEPTWKLNAVSVGVGAITVYLISNGFNAVNVQFRQRGIDAVISPEDLSLNLNASVPGLSTNATHSYPETQLRNPITNTILRNAVLPRVLNQEPHCDTARTEKNIPPDTAVEYGFAQRDWQTRVLQEALPAKQLHVVTTRRNVTLQDGATATDMPMNASLAADLYISGMNVLVSTFDMGLNYLNETEILKRNPSLKFDSVQYPDDVANKTLAKILGLLPSDSSDEMAQRAFFLKSSASGLNSQLTATDNMSANTSATAMVNMTLSHVQITDTIAFDAITFEFEIDPMMMAKSSTVGNVTRYIQFRTSDACGAIPGQCLVMKALFGSDTLLYDPPAQIQAFGQCLNGAGTEEMQAFGFKGGYPYLVPCKQSSKNSMLVFSVGKRVTADALTVNQGLVDTVFNSTNARRDTRNGTNVVTNPRKIFTVTIGRLNWQWTNLSSEFGASCASDDAATGGCLGLQLPLANTTTGTTSQTLVAGVNTLSVSTLSPYKDALIFKPRMLPLALIREPTLRNADAMYANSRFYGQNSDDESGDVLLRHNIKLRNWTDDGSITSSYSCKGEREERINATLDNHLYNEHGLQPMYTAGMFFLFENAVVQDVIRLNNNATTLDFKHNVKHVAVWLSIPDRSAWLTLAGCVLLVIGLVAALVQSVSLSKAQNDSLSKITAPHVIARVMLDEGQFPPLLLHRQIVNSQGDGEVSHFAINALGIQHQQSQDRLQAVV